MKKISLLIFTVLYLMASAGVALAETPEESFKKSFPGIHADSVSPTAVQGLYEVTVGSQVVYYAPGPEYLIYGPMVTSGGKNLTEERTTEIIGKKLRTVPLDKAIRIGTGPHQVIEVTDPDCTFCRKASAYLSGRKDITRYVFLMPLPMHKDAAAKALHILCMKDKARAYEEAMSGKMDDMKFAPCKSAAAEELLQEHRKIAGQAGITGTPVFLIDGQVVVGADIPRMEKLLKVKEKTQP